MQIWREGSPEVYCVESLTLLVLKIQIHIIIAE